MMIKHSLFFLLLLIIFLPSCNKESPKRENRIVIGISSDAGSLNPLFSFSGSESSISELLYLSLVSHEWDDETGELITSPMLADKWEWSEDSSSIIIYLRDSVYWTDGTKFTADDVVFSFDVYSDSDVQSRFYGTFENFYLDNDLHINMKETFEIQNPLTVKINFKEDSNPKLIDIDIPLLPKHAFEKVDRKYFDTAEKGMDSVTNGPFILSRWDKDQSIILRANDKCFLYEPENVQELIFKIVPDYNSRITQLRKGEIDLIEDVRREDAEDLKKLDHIKITSVQGREYDYIGWNNVEPGASSNKRIPHKLFGNPRIREALTYAINREEILDEFLGDYGSAAVGPVAPIFKEALNTSLKPLEYNKQKAKDILSSEGWSRLNRDKDGILEKKGKEFSFTLFIASGNPRREFAAAVIKNNLKSVGIDVKIESLETSVFIEKLFAKEFDAWMSGWSIPIPLDLKPYWHSNVEDNPLNFVSYKSLNADTYLEQIEDENSNKKKTELYKRFQEEIFKDKPVTFLYWVDNIVAYNNHIDNIKITPLGALHNCREWRVKPN